MKTISVEIPEGKEAKWVNNVLTLVDGQPKDITERIKTFEDAITWCGKNGKNYLCEEYCTAMDVGLLECAPDIAAYLKLRIITCALNEGWKPKFKNGDEYYFPHYYDESEDSTTFGITCWYSYDGVISTKLIYKNEELAKYAATQFKDIYMDFCYKTK